MELLTLKEVGVLINRKDNRSIKKWIRDHRIPIHKDGREFVYRLQVEQELWRPFAEDLVERYPNTWKYRLESIFEHNYQLYKLLYHDCLEFETGFVPFEINLDVSNKDHEAILQELYN